MMGVHINVPYYMFGDNSSASNGVSIPQYKISNKHLGICYHVVREASLYGIWRVGFVKYNITDLITKILSGTAK